MSIAEGVPAKLIATIYAEDPDLPENNAEYTFIKLRCDLDSPSTCGSFSFTPKLDCKYKESPKYKYVTDY